MSATASTIEWMARGFFLTEGPRFDGSDYVYFGDVTGHGLFRCRMGEDVEPIAPDRMSVGGVVLDETGGIICSGREGLARFDPKSGSLTPLPVSIDGVPLTNANDLEADADGNLYGGTLDYEAFEQGIAPRPSMLFRVNRDGTAVKLAEMPIPNGMDFAPDGRLYLSESGEGVFSYAIDPAGELTDRRCFAEMNDSDGIALDVGGGLWIARYLSDHLEYRRADGSLSARIQMPFAAVASVAFGGRDGRDLYVAGGSLTERGTGGIVRLRVPVPGLPTRKAGIRI